MRFYGYKGKGAFSGVRKYFRREGGGGGGGRGMCPPVLLFCLKQGIQNNFSLTNLVMTNFSLEQIAMSLE